MHRCDGGSEEPATRTPNVRGSLRPMLRLPGAIRTELVAHAIGGLPNEACGVFAAEAGPNTGAVVVERFFPIRNAAESQKIYTLDPDEYLAAEKVADDSGKMIVGVMHSHTHSTAYPSPTDVADAANFDPFGAWHFIIVSLKHADPGLRSYRIVDGNISEEDVVLDFR